jgi:hypothetical protein
MHYFLVSNLLPSEICNIVTKLSFINLWQYHKELSFDDTFFSQKTVTRRPVSIFLIDFAMHRHKWMMVMQIQMHRHK